MMFELERLREAVSDMLEQLDLGAWVDDQGHQAAMNVTVIRLRQLVGESDAK
jgi:hypothetical protein